MHFMTDLYKLERPAQDLLELVTSALLYKSSRLPGSSQRDSQFPGPSALDGLGADPTHLVDVGAMWPGKACILSERLMSMSTSMMSHTMT